MLKNDSGKEVVTSSEARTDRAEKRRRRTNYFPGDMKTDEEIVRADIIFEVMAARIRAFVGFHCELAKYLVRVVDSIPEPVEKGHPLHDAAIELQLFIGAVMPGAPRSGSGMPGRDWPHFLWATRKSWADDEAEEGEKGFVDTSHKYGVRLIVWTKEELRHILNRCGRTGIPHEEMDAIREIAD